MQVGICCICFKQAENSTLFNNGDRVCEDCLCRYAMEEEFNLEKSMAYISRYPYEFYFQSWFLNLEKNIQARLLQYVFAVYYVQPSKKAEMVKYIKAFCYDDFPHYIDFLVSCAAE